MAKWTTVDIPDQTGRIAVITGANTGLGYETASALAEHGAHVVLAVRNLDKGKDAAARITANSPGADVALQELDLTSLESVRAAADQLRSDYDHIDLLINNAGVMYTPKSTTKDGFGWGRAASVRCPVGISSGVSGSRRNGCRTRTPNKIRWWVPGSAADGTIIAVVGPSRTTSANACVGV